MPTTGVGEEPTDTHPTQHLGFTEASVVAQNQRRPAPLLKVKPCLENPTRFSLKQKNPWCLASAWWLQLEG